MKHFIISPIKIILLSLFILSACSKSGGSKSSPNNLQPEDSEAREYIVISENEAVEYSSQNIRIAEIIGDTLVYTMALMNNYEKNKQGEKRPGLHPETELRYQSATFKIVPSGNKVRLVFEMSSCKDINRNPFEGIIPTSEISIEELQDEVRLKFSDTEEDVLFEAEPNLLSNIFQSKVSRILCGDEKNE